MCRRMITRRSADYPEFLVQLGHAHSSGADNRGNAVTEAARARRSRAVTRIIVKQAVGSGRIMQKIKFGAVAAGLANVRLIYATAAVLIAPSLVASQAVASQPAAPTRAVLIYLDSAGELIVEDLNDY